MIETRREGRGAAPGASLSARSEPVRSEPVHSEPVSSEGDSTYAELATALAPSLALGHRLGEGGMGSVYAATHPTHGPVVVKVMHAHIDRRNAERFRLEGQAQARLHSPHIARILDWGMVGDQPYLVMERLEGRDLGFALDQGKLSVAETIKITKDVRRGLAVVHANKIVHRDIKPGNVFLAHGERGAVLLDFGVAKLLQRVTGIEPLQNATKTGTTVGTPRYISPEQAGAKPVDHRADLYSLAAVMFLMLTGENLFPSRTLSALLICHVKEPPRAPSSLVPEIPAALDRVVLRALAKKPNDRFPDAEAFLAALEEVERGMHGSPPAPVAHAATQILPDDWVDPAVSAGAGTSPQVTQQVVTTPMPRQPDLVPARGPVVTHPMSRQPAVAATVLEAPSERGPVPIAATAPMEIGGQPAAHHAAMTPTVRRPVVLLLVALAALAGFVLAVVLTLALTGGLS
jgi:serine/threonine protein kinase